MPACVAPLGVLAPPHSRAQPPAAGPIELEADSTEIDHKNNHSVFHKVRIRQGDMAIRAELAEGSGFAEAEWVFTGGVQIERTGTKIDAAQATINFLNHRIHRANLEGAPVTFEKPGRDGEALRIEIDDRNEKVELFERARVTREQDVVNGDYIFLDQRTEFFSVSTAKGTAPASPTGRVTAVLQPKTTGSVAEPGKASPALRCPPPPPAAK